MRKQCFFLRKRLTQFFAVGYHQPETCVQRPNSTDHTHSNVFTNIQQEDSATVGRCELEDLPAGLRYVAFLAIVSYVAAFSLSFGPITWILLTELYPVSLKGNAMSLGQAVNWTTNVFVSATFLDAVRVLTLPTVFSVYFLFSVVAIVFIYLCVPETKGKSLEEISRELKGLKPARPQVMTEKVDASTDVHPFQSSSSL